MEHLKEKKKLNCELADHRGHAEVRVQLWGLVLPFTIWALGVEAGPLGLEANAFTMEPSYWP